MLSCSDSIETNTCSDRIQNGNELGVDCGGDCLNCPTCIDGIQNGNEEGVDCGGDCSVPCHCVNDIKDGNEYCMDCGGDCPDCIINTERYLKNIYPEYLSLSVDDFNENHGKELIYGRNTYPSGFVDDLKMKIYEPESDFTSNRPLVFMIGGTSLNVPPNNIQLALHAKNLVGKGYVTSLVNTRFFDKGTPTMNEEQFTDALVKARSDVLAAIRYVRKNANELRIDPNNIWLMGYSGGAVISLYTAFLTENEIVDLDNNFVTVLDNNGGFEGNSGNPGYESNVKGVISLAGFMLHNHLCDPEDPLLISIRGLKDQFHPIGKETTNPDWLSFPLVVYGPFILHEKLFNSKFKSVYNEPANEWATLDEEQCPECSADISSFISTRMLCDE